MKRKVSTKMEEKNTKTISCNFKFIDRVRFIANSCSNIADNLIKRIHKIKCKY